MTTEPHRVACIDCERAAQIGFVLIDPNDRLPSPAENLPVKASKVFAGCVLAIVDELGGTTQLAGAMPATESPFDSSARDKPHMAQRRQGGDVEEAAAISRGRDSGLGSRHGRTSS